MAVVVDPAIWPHRGRLFCHLASDVSFDELHAFAADLGLPARAFHNDHYDLPAEWRGRAVEAGAIEVTGRELVRRLRQAGLRRAGRRADEITDLG